MASQKHAILLWGPAQTGKSTFLNEIRSAGEAVVPVGDGSGLPVTMDTTLRQTRIGPAIDSPGLTVGDTRKVEFINEKVAAAAGASSVVCLLFESAAGPSIQLRDSLDSLVRTVDKNILAGVVVVLSQCDGQPASRLQKRERKALEIIAQYFLDSALPQALVRWQPLNAQDAVCQAQQLHHLEQALFRVSFAAIGIQDAQSRLHRKAQELWEQQVPMKMQIDVEVERVEEYVEQEEYQEQEPYETQEEYTEQVPYMATETYTEKEVYMATCTKLIPRLRSKWKRGGGKVTRVMMAKTRLTQQVPKLRDVEKTREVLRYRTETKVRSVQGFRTVVKHRDVTRYQPVKRTIQHTVEVPKPIEFFYAEARCRIRDEEHAASTTDRPDSVVPDDSVSQGCWPLRAQQAASSQKKRVACPTAVSSTLSSASSSWISGPGENCFAEETLFKVLTPEAQFYKLVHELIEGDLVEAADGLRPVEVKKIKRIEDEDVLQIQAGEGVAPLRISSSHRVVVPGFGPHPTSQLAATLQEGDQIRCTSGVQAITGIMRLGRQPVWKIVFCPDDPVAVFHEPANRIWTYGSMPKPPRRGGMNRRSRGETRTEDGFSN